VKRKWLKRILISSGILVLISPCAYCSWILWGQELLLQGTISIYPGTEFIFEETAVWGANSAQKSLYYWNKDSVEYVREYYESRFTPFMLGEDIGGYGNWLITSFYSDGSSPKTYDSPSYLIHPSFCNHTEIYRCVTISLVEPDQENLAHLAVMSPSSFRRLTLPAAFDELPRSGTLIIYSYYVTDW
jgi:hypothetical protein